MIPNRIARLNTNGTTDTSFNPGLGLNASGECVAVLNDGRIMAGGQFTQARSTARARLAVFNADGTLDAFALAAGNTVRSLAVQTDGKVLIGGGFTTIGAVVRNRLARLTSLLALEPAYDPDADSDVYALTNRADGKTVIGGSFTNVGGTARNGIARLHNDVADSTLTVVNASLVQWLRGGSGQETARVTFELDAGGGYAAIPGTIARISGGWTLVPTTPLSGSGTIRARAYPEDSHSGGIHESLRAFNFAPEIGLEIDAVAVGDAGSLDVGEVRLGASRDYVLTVRNSGLADLTLTGPTPVTFSGTHAAQWSALSQPTLVIGPGLAATSMVRFTPTSEGTKTAVLNIASDDADEATYNVTLNGNCVPGVGSVDGSFSPVLPPASNVLALCVNEAEMLIGGNFTTVNALARKNLARLNLSGVVQASGAGANGLVWCAVELLNGKWMIGGDFTTIHGTARTRLARLNADGTLDTGFSLATNGSVKTLALQSDGAVLIGGDFTTIGGVARTRLARLTSSGALDTTYSPTANGEVLTIAMQTDGKALVCGYFSTLNGLSKLALARLNTDGTLDTSFATPLTAGAIVQTCVQQADGKVLLGTGTSGGLRRFTSAGATDATWTARLRDVRCFALQCDGKPIVCGYTATGIGAVERIGLTGTEDVSFLPLTPGTAMVGRLNVDGSVLVGGSNLTSSLKTLVRLINDAATGALSVTNATRVQWLRGGTAPEAAWVRFELSEDSGATWTLLGTGTRISGGWELTGLSLPIDGQVRGRASCGTALHDVVLSFSGLLVPDLDVTRLVTGAADVSVPDDGSVSFAGVQPTQTADVTLKLRNSGLATLTGLTLTMTGAEFSVISLDLTGLEPGQVATAIIRCTPSATGVRSGVLDITSNVPGTKAVYRVTLTGYGITNPAAITDAATLITNAAARLPVRVTANADVATAYVRYRRAGTADAWTLSPVPAWDIAGFTVASLYRDIGSLIAATSYEFQAVAINAVSTKEGTLRTFSTLA